MSFTIMMALVMAVIACSSILLAKEYISANVYKSARKKLIIINLVAIVGFAVLYPKILDFEYTFHNFSPDPISMIVSELELDVSRKAFISKHKSCFNAKSRFDKYKSIIRR